MGYHGARPVEMDDLVFFGRCGRMISSFHVCCGVICVVGAYTRTEISTRDVLSYSGDTRSHAKVYCIEVWFGIALE